MRRALLLPTFLFAGITGLTHVARYLRLTYSTYAAAAIVVVLLAAGAWVLLTHRERATAEPPNRLAAGLLLLAGVLGAALASIYRLPDADDYSYVPDAVHYLAYPEDPLGYNVHYAYVGGQPHFSIIEVTAQPFEYAQALVSSLTGLDYLTIYHMVTPALAGFLLPLAVFLMLSSFSPRALDSALATLLVVGLLTLLGESKIAIGSLSFTRIFQGKIVLIAAGIPAFTGLSLDYLRDPALRRWLALLVLSTALAGLSSTAFFLIPMLALALGIAGFFSLGPSLRRIPTIAAYGLSCVYPVTYGLYAARSVTQLLTPGGAVSALFMETLQRWTVPDRPVSAIAFAVSLLAIGALSRGFPRRFLLAWTAAACLLYLNPWVAPLWVSRATGELVYWRTIFTLPFVAAAGTAFAAGLEWREGLSPQAKVAITAVVLACFAGLNFIPGSTSIFRRGGEIGLPGLKVREDAYQVALAVTGHVPPGVMLAPEEISGTTPMVRGGYPQVRLPDWELQAWASGSADEVRRAASFAEGDERYRESFLELVQDMPALKIVVLREEAFGSVGAWLAERGFSQVLRQSGYVVVWASP